MKELDGLVDQNAMGLPAEKRHGFTVAENNSKEQDGDGAASSQKIDDRRHNQHGAQGDHVGVFPVSDQAQHLEPEKSEERSQNNGDREGTGDGPHGFLDADGFESDEFDERHGEDDGQDIAHGGFDEKDGLCVVSYRHFCQDRNDDGRTRAAENRGHQQAAHKIPRHDFDEKQRDSGDRQREGEKHEQGRVPEFLQQHPDLDIHSPFKKNHDEGERSERFGEIRQVSGTNHVKDRTQQDSNTKKKQHIGDFSLFIGQIAEEPDNNDAAGDQK